MGWILGNGFPWALPKQCSFEDTCYRCLHAVHSVTPGGSAEAVGVKAGDTFEGDFDPYGEEYYVFRGAKSPRSLGLSSVVPGSFGIFKMKRWETPVPCQDFV